MSGRESKRPPALAGLRVVELADERGEYAGMLLAALGADVVKVEPPAGSPTRAIGPFVGDEPGPDRSLHFWAFNRAKRSVVLDVGDAADRDALARLVGEADIVLDSLTTPVAALVGGHPAALCAEHPQLIYARMSDFGDAGPWAGFKASDLVHLALGGPMMNCGYDPRPDGTYDVAPIAPQLWHAAHIAGEQLVMGVLAAVLHRNATGNGQVVSCAIHEAVSKNTELDLMNWIMRRAELHRQTCRHAAETVTPVTTISHTKDGRWLTTNLLGAGDRAKLAEFLAECGIDTRVAAPAVGESAQRAIPGSGEAVSDDALHVADGMQRLLRRFTFADAPWRAAQDKGLIVAPLRLPHENLADEHWLRRGTFEEVCHPELDRGVAYPVRKWISTANEWQTGPRPPLLGEHTAEVLASARPAAPRPLFVRARTGRLSARGAPLPLEGVRIFDFTWFLASAGATRFLAALGAESLKVEWKSNPDTRLGAMAPVGGRRAREEATGPLAGVTDPDMGGQFNNKNAGKRGLSLNVRDPRGLEIAKQLIAVSDIVAEGFSPGVLDRWGLGYDVLRQLRPDVIYAQQSGMGARGAYGRLRAVGPAAAAFAGTSEMSGLPAPAMPAGWGYSYLDWMGAYSFATAILTALHHRDVTGEGQWIDASQCESGIFLTGIPVLDWSVNERPWSRIGNRSPYKPAAPHGVYRCQGADRWIAITCFDDDEWAALANEIDEAWARDPALATLAGRLEQQDPLDARLSAWTSTRDDYELMYALQRVGVAAGSCQTAADRCERDPQLAHLGWLTEVTGTKIGRWPVAELSARLSSTPPYAGGYVDRGAPCYGEDNEYILGELLGYGSAAIAELAAEGVI